MNEREVSEIRRRFRADKTNITHIRGCYVSDKGEILSDFTQSVSMMLDDEKEKVLAVLKKALSGSLGKNLMDISFATSQVASGEAHKRLQALRTSQLKDDEAAKTFFEQVIQSVTMETNYLILLAYDAYDVPRRGRDGLDLDSENVFSYMLCAVCPVKLSKSQLSYDAPESVFRNSKTSWIVSAPEVGFLFPAFDDRSTNLYGALFYTHSPVDPHEDFMQNVFETEPPMPAAAQKANFQTVLKEALNEDCSLAVAQKLQTSLSDMIQEHKESREREPLVISKPEVHHILESCGVAEEKVKAFDEGFDQSFGAYADLPPRNLVSGGKYQITTPDVTISVAADRRELVETRVIGGVKYILVRAEDGAEADGLPIVIQ